MECEASPFRTSLRDRGNADTPTAAAESCYSVPDRIPYGVRGQSVRNFTQSSGHSLPKRILQDEKWLHVVPQTMNTVGGSLSGRTLEREHSIVTVSHVTPTHTWQREGETPIDEAGGTCRSNIGSEFTKG